ncbi:predicted protein [Naegleria gruberi]|uniref:Predicted protein n=1 Tax=Naegleria gruberi TaxID=5762 RepID=D2V5K1_NAEGR|nr:uncharacterized protein NAEGRDRAFT_46850 [Naegleria gruberi]EFC47812.1 predicted protein [Naegleria gruberi]|eukprot:XP_002680556.1 predicted protein [Naegleria gruberi strain NEG-M]
MQMDKSPINFSNKMTQLPIRKVNGKLSEPSTSSAIKTDNKILQTVSKTAERNIFKKQIQPLSDIILETDEDHGDDIKCVRTNHLTKFKAFSAPTPQNNHEHDFRSSDSNSSTNTSSSNTKRPISHLYIQSSLEINHKTFKQLPFELIFDLIFPFLCLPDILQFSSSCKLFQSYIFHIIEPNDSMWRHQLQNTIPFLNQLTNRRILEMNNRNSKGLNSVQHQALIMQGVLQEFIVRVRRRIQYFEGILSEELIVKHSNSLSNKVNSIPPNYRNNTAVAGDVNVPTVVESIVGSDYEGFFELGEDYSIRKCVISICSEFLREIKPFSLEHVHIHEFYDPSQYNTSLKKKNSLKNLLKHHSLRNLTLSPSENSDNQHYFDNDTYKHQLLQGIQSEETLQTCRMTIVGCSERAVHPCILQTFRKNQFPEDYISIYGKNFSSDASIRNTQYE